MGMCFSILSRPKNSIYQSGRLFLLAIFLTFLFSLATSKNHAGVKLDTVNKNILRPSLMFGKNINHGVSYRDEENRLRQGRLVEKLFGSVQKNTREGKTTFIAVLGPEASG